MSIVSSASIIEYLDASAYSDNIKAIHEGVEQFVKITTGQPWESTTYINKLYNGSGRYTLQLDDIPVISVKFIALDVTEVIKIKHTLTDATLANIIIDATNITLTVEGGVGDSTVTLSKSTYTTMTLLVDAINAQIAKGWSAALYDSKYANLRTAYLQDQQIECVNEDNVIGGWHYLTAIHNFARNISIDKKSGIVVCGEGFPAGFNNICITYTAGYETPPSDISYFILNAVKKLNGYFSNNAEGLTEFRVGDISYKYGQMESAGIEIPNFILSGRRKAGL
jgi:hypothetical protein